MVWKISCRGKWQAYTEMFTWNIYLPNLGYHWWSAVKLYINLLQMKLRKAFSILFSAKVVTENIMNTINRKRGKCKLIQQDRFTFSPALHQLAKAHLWLWGPLIMEVAAVTCSCIRLTLEVAITFLSPLILEMLETFWRLTLSKGMPQMKQVLKMNHFTWQFISP